MIDLNDSIITQKPRKTPRFEGEIVSHRYYRCWCDQCGDDRGYLSKSRYQHSKLCRRCKMSSSTTRENMRLQHWSKSGTYSPKHYTTEQQQKDQRDRELQYMRNYGRQYYQQHKEIIIAKRQQRLDININAKIASRLRSRLYIAIKNHHKVGSAVSDLGCSIDELRLYLQNRFQDGMTWDNYGEWHIDHIVPLSSFNLENRDELGKACHYSNLQPLWAFDNLSKGDRQSFE